MLLAYQVTSLVSSDETVQRWIKDFGLGGIFIISAISGFNLVVPIPIATFIPVFLESGFNFYAVILIISLGMTTGDILSYLIGSLGRRVIITEESLQKHWFVKLINKSRAKYKTLPYVILFIFASVVPIPNEITVMPMGFLGYKMKIIIPILIVGNLIFNFWAGQSVEGIFNFID